MTQEKKDWMIQVANIVRYFVEENMYDESISEIDVDSPFWDTRCKFVSLVYELRQFQRTLENMVKYSEISKSNNSVK